jgi:hypothetical protein
MDMTPKLLTRGSEMILIPKWLWYAVVVYASLNLLGDALWLIFSR